MANLTNLSTVVVANDQVWCDLAGEAAILNLKNGVYYGLDPVGARIWQLMQTPTTVSVICDAVTQEYDVDPAQCRQDVLKLLDELVLNELIELRDDTPNP